MNKKLKRKKDRKKERKRIIFFKVKWPEIKHWYGQLAGIW